MASTTSERLQLLLEHVRLTLAERKRKPPVGGEADARSDFEISRSLDTLQQGINQLEKEQRQLEEAGDLSTDALREREDVLINLRTQYDDLYAQFTAVDVDDGPSLDPSPSRFPSSGYPRQSEDALDESAAREALMGSRDTPSTMRKSNKTVRFRDSLVDAEELDNQEVLQLHRRVMEEQDENLDRLSASIRNQRELSIQIGDELESHVQLLDDVDGLVDRHTNRLDKAKKRLNHVAHSAKDHGSLVVIAILIIILVLLIIILK